MNRVAIVTGAASGIGRELASALVNNGDHVVLADVNEAGLRQAVAELGSSAAAAVLDVRDPQAVSDLVRQVTEARGRLDLMFNNAGLGWGGEIDELVWEHWTRLIEANVMGVIHGTVAAYRVMVDQGSGHIVNTASLAGLGPSPLLTPYSMTKHAVVGLSLSLRAEAAARGVRVSVVCPGVIETPILDTGPPTDLPPVAHEYDGRVHLTHAAGRPHPAAALASDVLRGVERNQAVIVAPRRARIVWRLYRLAPALVERKLIENVAWTRQHALREPRPHHPPSQIPDDQTA